MIQFPYHIILASNSPRRRELLAGLNLPFEVRVLPDVAEDYPDTMPVKDVAGYISREKAAAYKPLLKPGELVLTADTVVLVDDEVLGKPHDEAEARVMLHKLSGRTHQVVTGVTLLAEGIERSFSVCTDVTFKMLAEEEIDYYVREFRPLDKAGAYGIQEWIGYVGVTALNGSYFNVMGFPVQRVWEALQEVKRLAPRS